MEQVLNAVPTVIVGEKTAGEAHKIRKQLEQLIKKVNNSAFDIGDLLWTIKSNSYYEGFNTFTEYVKTLNIKYRKARYLTRISEVMHELNVPRETYEPIGIAKLREITSLDTNGTWINPETKEETPIKAFVQGFIEKGQELPLEEIQQHVRTLKGITGENAFGWIHLYMKQLAIDNVARPALEKAKAMIGTVAKDEEGNSKDASDGQAAESIFATFLSGEGNE